MGSTEIPNYDPLKIIENIRLYIKGKKMKPMKPWYRNFQGKIDSSGRGTYHSTGVWEQKGSESIEITELPIRKWTQDYKEFLQGMLPGAEKKSKIALQDFREYHTERTVHFNLKFSSEEIAKAKSGEGGVKNNLKLCTNVNETNMVLFDSEGRIQKYKNAVQIMEEFCKVRLKYYDLRKKYLIDKLTLERDLLSNRARFIKMIIEKKLKISNRKKADVVKDLTKMKFQKFGDVVPPRTGFEYLLIMQIASLTYEKYEELKKMAKDKSRELEEVKRTPIKTMWSRDLDRLEAGIEELYAKEAEEIQGAKERKKGKKGKSTSQKRKRDDKDKDKDDENDGDGGDDDDAPANS